MMNSDAYGNTWHKCGICEVKISFYSSWSSLEYTFRVSVNFSCWWNALECLHELRGSVVTLFSLNRKLAHIFRQWIFLFPPSSWIHLKEGFCKQREMHWSSCFLLKRMKWKLTWENLGRVTVGGNYVLGKARWGCWQRQCVVPLLQLLLQTCWQLWVWLMQARSKPLAAQTLR